MELTGSLLSPNSQNKKPTLKQIFTFSKKKKGFPYAPGNGYFLYFVGSNFSSSKNPLSKNFLYFKKLNFLAPSLKTLKSEARENSYFLIVSKNKFIRTLS